jgi:acetyl-CoA carboxylase carboxyltransferase component
MDKMMNPKIEKLHRLRHESKMGGGEARIARQRAKGKMTAHERLNCSWTKDRFANLILSPSIVSAILEWMNSVFPAIAL